MHFTIKEEGVFWGQCAEFCGEAHSLMGIRVVAESEEDFQAWVNRLAEHRPPRRMPRKPGVSKRRQMQSRSGRPGSGRR